MLITFLFFFFFSSRRRHTRLQGDWSSDVCSSDLDIIVEIKLLSVIVPSYRQEKTIKEDLSKIKEVLDKLRYQYEIICVEIGRASCGKECRSRWSPYH